MNYIIGGEGFVGSAMTRYCQQSGIDHVVLNRHNYNEYVGTSCDVLINANGNSKKLLSRDDPLLDFQLSVVSVRKTLIDFKCQKYVLCSSCDVYPDCSEPLTTREDLPLEVARQSAYGFHKFMAEQCVRHAAENWLVIRFGGFVGPHMRKNAIYDILNGGPLWLHPDSMLQYLHTDDAARIVFKLIKIGVNNQIVNVCGNGLIRLRDVIDCCATKIPVQAGSPKVTYNVNIDKLKQYCEVPESCATVMKFVRNVVGNT